MADIKSINGNPIVVGTSGIEDGAVTDAKLATDYGGEISRNTMAISTVARDVSESSSENIVQTLAFKSGALTLPNRHDYISATNPVIIENGDTFTINYDLKNQVNRIIYRYFDADGNTITDSYFSLVTKGSRTITCSEENARYVLIIIWSGNTSIILDPADFIDRVWIVVNPKESAEFTPRDLFDFTVADMEANDMYVTPERLTWKYGLLSPSDGVSVTASRTDYVYTDEYLDVEYGDTVTIEFGSFSDQYYEQLIKYAFSFYYDENDEFITRNQAAKVSFNSTNRTVTFNPPVDAKSMRFALWSAAGSAHQDIDIVRRFARVYKNRPSWMLSDTVQNLSLINDTTKSYVTRVLGATDPQWIGEKFSLTDAYVSSMREAVTSWMAAYAGDQTKVPFIICTDQHARLNSARKQIFDVLSHIVNWDGVSAFFNLGDTVGDHWEADDTNEDVWLRNAELERAGVCLSSIPRSKMVAVYGNHDTWANQEGGFLHEKKYINPYFVTGKPRTVVLPDNSGNMVVYDDYWCVKYVVVACWDYTTTYNVFKLSADHWRWVIGQLEKNDGYDVVIVSHVPIIMRSANAFDPTTSESLSGSTYYIGGSDSPAVFNARQKKTAGSITIDEEVIQYDFTQCERPLLCNLCGHTHVDAIDRAGGADGLMVAAFDWFAYDTLHFGFIDRGNETLEVWKLANDDSTPSVQHWSQPLYVSAE